MDIGVHKDLDIEQEEYCFDVCFQEDSASVLINSFMWVDDYWIIEIFDAFRNPVYKIKANGDGENGVFDSQHA